MEKSSQPKDNTLLPPPLPPPPPLSSSPLSSSKTMGNLPSLTNIQPVQGEGNPYPNSYLTPKHTGNLQNSLKHAPLSYKEKVMNNSNHIYFDSWVDEFSTNPEIIVTEDASVEDVSVPVVTLSMEEKLRISQPWKNTLLIKLIGHPLSLIRLEPKLQKLWKISKPFQMIDLGHSCFNIRFSSPEDYISVLAGGPRILFGHYLKVQIWQPDFRPTKDDFDKLAIWIQLPELPIEYYDPTVLFKIGRLIGKPIKIDVHTGNLNRGRYARICLEIGCKKSLPKSIKIGKFEQKIYYKISTRFCSTCGTFDHENCLSSEVAVKETTGAGISTSSVIAEVKNTMEKSDLVTSDSGKHEAVAISSSEDQWHVVTNKIRKMVRDKSTNVQLPDINLDSALSDINSKFVPNSQVSSPDLAQNLIKYDAMEPETLNSSSSLSKTTTLPPIENQIPISHLTKSTLIITTSTISSLEKQTQAVISIPTNASSPEFDDLSNNLTVSSTIQHNFSSENSKSLYSSPKSEPKRPPSPPINSSFGAWNVRGAGRPKFLHELNGMIARLSPQILILMETKVSSSRANRIISQLPFYGKILVNPIALSGGIWLLWDPNLISVHSHPTSSRMITAQFHPHAPESPFSLTAVY
ncbi:Endonuclease/exonuclease/phosphatase [Corchorus capsularis]|uniref:Endonuclease/exonuclease/phosphatase n=1 Tax=Corchorus capsularis TaxID=210143 RepID=A0A1R3JVY9_COCAP|nr:Endonuclease/exonuclease/phosphatase [Corchorus capsularis]